MASCMTQRVAGVHTMVRRGLAMLLGVVLAGCATYWQAHTTGTSGPIAWSIADAQSAADRVGERYAYTFVLVLQETQGTPLTFTTLTYTVYSGRRGHPIWRTGADHPGNLEAPGAWDPADSFYVHCYLSRRQWVHQT